MMGSTAVLDSGDAGVSAVGAKRKGRAKQSSKRKNIGDSKHELKAEDENAQSQIASDKPADTVIVGKRPRRAAACSNFKEKAIRLDEKSSMIETHKDRVAAEETDAVLLTKLGPEDHPPCRKLVDFILHDSDGNSQPFEMSEIDDTFITSIVMPMDDSLEKEKDKGVKCTGFGRIESWAISGYEEGTPVIWISTEIADYECVKAAASYKKFYDRFWEKARVCIEVFKKLSRSNGGDPNLTLEELLARVARSMSGSKSFPVGSSGIDFLVSLGDFIYNQLTGLDENSENNDDVKFATSTVLLALREQCKSRTEPDRFHASSGGSLVIEKTNKSEVIEDEDEKLARLLQEEEDWKSMKQRNNRQNAGTRNKFYIKINEDEIANDYPLPAYYKPCLQEMDEYIFFDCDDTVHYDALPYRVLNNWSLYNSDSRLISLELLPMKPCSEVDVTIFGSGIMKDDDGTGFCIDLESGGQASSAAPGAVDNEGVPVYLSSIKEWVIEFGSNMVFISIRTDIAWYRLGKPTKQYAPWYEPVLKTARVAISIIALLKEQTRASKLSFSYVIKKLTDFDKTNPAYISSNVVAVERYVVVHGQIILQLFAVYPDKVIQKSSFIVGLSEKMEQRHHTKLVMKKKNVLQKETNMNPSASMVPIQSNRKVMRATMTKLINRIWGDYYSKYLPAESQEGSGNELKEEEEPEEQEENEDEEAEADVETVLVQDDSPKPNSSGKLRSSKSKCREIKWEGAPTGKTSAGWPLYKNASVRGETISVGGVVMVESDDPEEMSIFFVEYMFETPNGGKLIHGRVLTRGFQTVLGNAANKGEMFLTNECLEFELSDVKESAIVEMPRVTWGHNYRKENDTAEKNYQAKAEEREKKGLPMEYFCKCLYWPQRGAFMTLPYKTMGLGTGECHSCKIKEADKEDLKMDLAKSSFVYKKVEYHVHDFVYVSPEQFGELNEDCGTFKGGRNVGLKAYVVCHLLEIEVRKGSKQVSPETANVKIRRFYRPEDISAEKAYRSDIREVFYSEDTYSIPIEALEGKCELRKKSQLPDIDVPVLVDNVFFCERSYDPEKGTIKQLPANIRIQTPAAPLSNNSALRKAKGKGKCDGEETKDSSKWEDVPKEKRLSTLDIFAGCGGLSEGLQQSGASFTKWAIEYEQPAGEAFSRNHPDATVFIDNCNVILRAIMEKCGDADECVATTEAIELAAKLDEEKRNNLPLPGEVDFINGGPPCQGFSGMNRFNQGTWSKVQCEMILAFLSFADYFRPRFFLLENVRTFVSFNKGQTFRLTLASLLDMGYQVRFGVLEAGTFGVSQSRKRAFIWAAAPEETLPEWPEPVHVFAGPELKISLPGGVHYAAARSTAGGAPFRSITVRDTIGDLPQVTNGASRPEIEYDSEPVSWFQKQIRRNMVVLEDHISKEMNELNCIRCQHIPRRPGADWRDLPEKKVKLSTGQMVDLIPWCLPNTAKRHNQWKGLFGRLDWEGNFPTSITDPQPMGKVGMCFHPEQDRILTVRECARSQGFADSYHFCGNIQNKHRQIGNAVPPPLAYALGRKLKEVVDAKQSK